MSAGQGHMIGTQGGRVPLRGHWGGCEWPCVQRLAWPQLLRGQVSLGDSRAARLRTLSEVTNYMSVERWLGKLWLVLPWSTGLAFAVPAAAWVRAFALSCGDEPLQLLRPTCPWPRRSFLPCSLTGHSDYLWLHDAHGMHGVHGSRGRMYHRHGLPLDARWPILSTSNPPGPFLWMIVHGCVLFSGFAGTRTWVAADVKQGRCAPSTYIWHSRLHTEHSILKSRAYTAVNRHTFCLAWTWSWLV